jgi:hypothetical protein
MLGSIIEERREESTTRRWYVSFVRRGFTYALSQAASVTSIPFGSGQRELNKTFGCSRSERIRQSYESTLERRSKF